MEFITTMDQSLIHLPSMHCIINGRYSQTEKLMNVQAIRSCIFATTSSQLLVNLLGHPHTEEEIGSPNPPQSEILMNEQAIYSCFFCHHRLTTTSNFSLVNGNLLLHFPQLMAIFPSVNDTINTQPLAFFFSHPRAEEDIESPNPPQSEFIMKVQAFCSCNFASTRTQLLAIFPQPSSHRGRIGTSK